MTAGSKKNSIAQILRGAHPEIRALIRVAHEQGYRISKRGNGHFGVVPPPDSECTDLIFVPFTPSSNRVITNVRGKLRRIGVKFETG